MAVVNCHESSVAESLALHSGHLLVDGIPVLIELGVESRGDDWLCRYCNAKNYHWRTACYKCLVLKGQHESTQTLNAKTNPEPVTAVVDEGEQDISPMATKFLLLRRLKGGLTIDSFYKVIKSLVETTVAIWQVIDRQTRAYRRFAFIEYSSSDDAQQALSILQKVSPSQVFENGSFLSFGRDLYALNSYPIIVI